MQFPNLIPSFLREVICFAYGYPASKELKLGKMHLCATLLNDMEY